MNAALLPEDDQPLRIKAIARCLGISDKTVRRRIDSGDIESRKMGGLRVVRRQDFVKYWKNLPQSGDENV